MGENQIIATEQNDVQLRIAEKKKTILEQLVKSPVIQLMCDKVSVSRSTFYRFKKEDKEFAKAADEALKEGLAVVTDVAESNLIAAVAAGDQQSVTLWLKTHHPSYRSRFEINGVIHHKDDELTPEQEEIVKRAVDLANFNGKLIKNHERGNSKENSGEDVDGLQSTQSHS